MATTAVLTCATRGWDQILPFRDHVERTPGGTKFHHPSSKAH